MPLNTSARQTTDKAGAATEGVLPAEEDERPASEAAPAASQEPADRTTESGHEHDTAPEPETDTATREPDHATAGREPEAAPEAEAKAGPEPELKSKPEAEPDAEPEAEAKAGPKSEPEPKPEPEAEPEAEAKSEPEPKSEPEAEPEAKATAPEADREPAGHAEPAEHADPAAGSATAAENETATEPEPELKPEPEPDSATPERPRPRWRTWRSDYPVAARVLGICVTVLAGVIVVLSLVMPNTPEALQTDQFIRLPVEALIGAAALTALPRRPRLVVAWFGGVTLGVMTVLNALDIGFNQYLGRGFNVILDWPLFSDAYSYLQDTLGGTGALGALVAVIVIVLAVLAFSALAVVRLSNVMARHRATTTRTVLVLSLAWMTCTTLGLQHNGVPLAADTTVTMLKNREIAIRQSVRDEHEFSKTAAADAFGATPGSQLVPDLRGKDMIFTFIESYGRSAIEDPIMAPGVDATLDARTQALAKAGFHAKSGWLTSATYGGSSWLGHSTFMSGLWVNNQNRYRTVTASDHLTLTDAFKKTGAWDTVGVMPGVQKGWPESKWYGLDKVYNAFDLGYKGPKFSWSTMPDQYTLEQFQQRVHGKKHDKPLTSFVILTSSHTPWAPIPKMVGWDQLGDGSIFNAIEKAGHDPSYTYTSDQHSREEYGKSVQYSVTALTEWLERYGNENTVLVFLGDHQANAHVSGNNASHDVPCAIVAKDPKVLDKIASWGWTDGLRPAHNAPVWKMSSFRDRFLTAYGSTPHPKG